MYGICLHVHATKEVFTSSGHAHNTQHYDRVGLVYHISNLLSISPVLYLSYDHFSSPTYAAGARVRSCPHAIFWSDWAGKSQSIRP